MKSATSSRRQVSCSKINRVALRSGGAPDRAIVASDNGYFPIPDLASIVRHVFRWSQEGASRAMDGARELTWTWF
jgi:hypothetical protein